MHDTITLDDMPEPWARFEYDTEFVPADPESGVMRAHIRVDGRFTAWGIGPLELTRDQLIVALGRAAVLSIEQWKETTIDEGLNTERMEA